MTRVFASVSIPEPIIGPLRSIAEVSVWEGEQPISRGDFLESIATCAGILSTVNVRVDSEALAAAPDLRVVSQMAVGVDNIDIAACTARGILVGHTPDVLTETTADTAFALMAAVVRRIPEGDRIVRNGLWGPWDPWFQLGGDLHGSTLGIVGMGRIGTAVARRAQGFDMDVCYASRSQAEGDVGRRVTLEKLLALSDVVVLAAPLTTSTHHMIGADELALMRPDSYLINVGRGPLISTDALIEALSRGGLAGVGLDVTDPEPLPMDHPLLEFDNCLVVPHIGSASVRTRTKMAQLAVDNLAAGLSGSDLPAPLQSGPDV